MSGPAGRLAALSPEQLALLVDRLRPGRGANSETHAVKRRAGPVPASFAQRRIWVQENLVPGRPSFHSVLAIDCEGDLDVAAMKRAFAEAVNRHEPLRTAIEVIDGEPCLAVSAEARSPFAVADLSGLPEPSRSRALESLTGDCVKRTFDFAAAPLFRVFLARVEAKRHVLLICLHHLIFDAWSAGVLAREIAHYYEAFVERRATMLPALGQSYSDFAALQQQRLSGGLLDRDLEYWRSRLAGLPPLLELPSDRPRRPIRSTAGNRRVLKLESALFASVSEFAKREGCTVFTVLMTAFQVLLHRLTGRSDLVAGTSVSQRDHKDWEALVGLFVNTLAIRVDAAGDPPFREFMARAGVAIMEALEHGAAPFDRVVEALRIPRDLSASPVFQVALVLESTPHEAIALRGLDLQARSVHNGASPYDLFLLVEEEANGLRLTAEYCEELFDAATIDAFLAHYREILKSALRQPAERLSRLKLLPDGIRDRILADFNDTACVYGPAVCIHQRFEEQVQSAPDRPALECAGESRSYRELNAGANRLAHFLGGFGAGPEVAIAVYLERSVELVQAFLGILKSGACFLYLDPKHPLDRIAAILGRARPPLILTDSALAGRLPMGWAQVICIDAVHDEVEAQPNENPRSPVLPSNLAYLIYTSGTTGAPKGVMVEHAGLAHLARWQRQYFGITSASRVSQLASYSFDGAIGETVMALLNGATLVLLDRERLEPESLAASLNRNRIDALVAVPSVLKGLNPELLDDPGRLTVISVGEACPDEMAQQWARRANFVNAYGPSEYTVYSHAWREQPGARPATSRSVPIGGPMSNTRSYILDTQLNPLPIGAAGELYLSGTGIARGYSGDPALTAERFMPNPFAYFQEARPLALPSAVAAIESFRQEHGAHLPRRPDIPVEQSIASLDPDLADQTRGRLERLAGDPCALGGFLRYFSEGVEGSYAAAGLNAEALWALLDIADFQGLRGIDFGFGNGEVLSALVSAGALVKGLDICPFFVQRARSRGLDVAMAKVDVAPNRFFEECGIEEGSQDFALSTLLLDRLEQPRHLLANLLSVLRPGGRFAVQTLLPIVPADDGAVQRPIIYTAAADRITSGVDASEDQQQLAQLLEALGAGGVKLWQLPYVVASLDGVQKYEIYSFTGRRAAAGAARDPYLRMYRSGDLARYLPDGAIEYCGRIDDQVKILGSRAEPAEVAAVLRRSPNVADAIVTARPDAAGAPRLVAYAVPAHGAANGRTREFTSDLRRFLEERLPRHMVPSHVVALDSLPVNSNGKVDVARLPQPKVERAAARPPASDVEHAIAEAWQKILGLAEVSLDDNIFELGADSIVIVRIVAELHRVGLRFTAEDFFRRQTIAGLAPLAVEAPATVEPVGAAGWIPLTPIQQWFFAQQQPDPHHYNQSLLLTANQAIEANRLRRATAALTSRHAALRLRFRNDGETWSQRVSDGGTGDCFCHFDLSGLPPNERRRTLEITAAELQKSLDFERGPIFRLALLELGEEPARVLLIAHHLAVDAFSWHILVSDLEKAYSDSALGTARTYTTRPLATDPGYWHDRLPVKVPSLPRQANGFDHNLEEHARTATAWLESQLTGVFLQQLGEGARPEELVAAAVVSAIRKWTGEGGVLLDVERHGRNERPEIGEAVGWFTEIVPLFVETEESAGASAILRLVSERLRSVPRGNSYLRAIFSDGQAGFRAKAQVSLNYLGRMEEGPHEAGLFSLAGESAGAERSPRQRRQYLLEFVARVRDGRLCVDLRYGPQVHQEATMTRLLGNAMDALGTLLAAVDEPFPLTPLQQGMLFHSLAAPGSGVYQNVMRFRVRGGVDRISFQKAWDAVIARHPALAAEFLWEGRDVPAQVVRRGVTVPLETEAGSGQDVLERERRRSSDLSRAPLMRLRLAPCGDGLEDVYWSFHHILIDGWSVAIVLREMLTLYEAYREGRSAQLVSAPPFRQYLDWLAVRDGAAAERYWRAALAGFASPTPVPFLDAPRMEEPVCSHREAIGRMDRPAASALARVARERRWTPNTFFQAAWAILLSAYTGERDVVHGVTTAGRPPDLAGANDAVGLFINTLPLRLDVDPEMTLDAFLDRLQAQLTGAEQFAYASLSDIRRWSEIPGGRGLFGTVVIVENYPLDHALRDYNGSIRVEEVECVQQSNYPLTLSVAPGEEIGVRLLYDPALFDQAQVRQILEHYLHLLRQLTDREEQRLGNLTLLDGPARQAFLSEAGGRRRAVPERECIHEIFESVCSRNPDAVAVRGEVCLTFGALNARANRIAHCLRRYGAGPESLVGILVERSPEMYLGLLAILKAGAAYVPLEPGYPPQRLMQLADDAGLAILITEQALAGRLPDFRGSLILLDTPDEAIERAPAGNGASAAMAENLAYVMYTSGSTGRPKGVLGTHRSTLNCFYWMWEAYPFHPGEVCCQKTALGFGDSIQEIFGPLLKGVPATIIDDETVRDPERMVRHLGRERVTRIVLVPSLLRAILDTVPDLGRRLPELKLWIASGEVLPSELARRFEAAAPGAILVNLYGNSETSNDVTWCEAGRVAKGGAATPIGGPIDNLEVYLLDGRLNPAPPGVQGEIFVGGRGLNRGYLGRPDLTAAAFLPHPFSAMPGERLYRTGDVGCRTAGTLECRGRTDRQLKIRGQRVELGEIAAALKHHPGIEDAVVLAPQDAAGERYLAAYVVPTVRQRLLASSRCYRLPNGIPVLHHSKSETDFQFQEIFEDRAYLRHGLRIQDGDCIFDAGANIGMFALWAHVHCPAARVYAFEPNPELFALLSANIELQGMNARPCAYGLAEAADIRRFAYYPRASVLSGFRPVEQRDAAIFRAAAANDPAAPAAEIIHELAVDRFEARMLELPVRTLSQAIREIGVERIDLLKIDVERSELDLLRGIDESDWDRISQISAEVEDSDGALLEFVSMLRGHGFAVREEQSDRFAGAALFHVSARRGGLGETVDGSAPRAVQAMAADDLSPQALRRFLSAKLPAHMVPSRYSVLEAFPRTTGGKVDRQELLRLPVERAASEVFEAPRSETETSLAEIWAGLLEAPRVRVHDNWFDMGAHSLLVLRAHEAVCERLKRDVTIVDFYRHPTVAELARHLDGASPEPPGGQGPEGSLRRGEERRRRAEAAGRKRKQREPR